MLCPPWYASTDFTHSFLLFAMYAVGAGLQDNFCISTRK